MTIDIKLYQAGDSKHGGGASHMLFTKGIIGTPVARAWVRNRSGIVRVQIDLDLLKVYIKENKRVFGFTTAVYRQGVKDGIVRAKALKKTGPRVQHTYLPPLSYFMYSNKYR